jgi:tRNA modification GTPase
VVVLTGAPNVGKSSLFNRLAQRDIAIVTDVPGTTRDALEVRLDLDGLPVVIVDTAGLRASDDVVELEGMARTRRWLARCDLVLEVRDALDAGPIEVDAAPDAFSPDPARPRMLVINKSDLAGRDNGMVVAADDGPERLKHRGGIWNSRDQETILRVSALTGDGIAILVEAIARFAMARLAGAETAVLTHERQRFHALAALEALEAAHQAVGSREGVEIVAEHVQVARQALGHLVGQVGVDEWLDQVFRRFCIGK